MYQSMGFSLFPLWSGYRRKALGRDNECAERICTGGHVCDFNAAVSGSVCQVGGEGDDSDQCDGSGICADCTDTGGCGDYFEDANPCTDLACPEHVCTDESDNTNACDLSYDCTDDHCVDGACLVETVTTGCLIEDGCVAEGQSQDTDGCVACDPSATKTAWTNMDGAVCAVTDDGKPCTDDVCLEGACVAENDESNSCTDAYGCTNTECSGGDCIVSGTNTGCFIEDACFAEGATETVTGDGSCQVCEGTTDWDGWTMKESGDCDDGDACTHTDTCGTGGVCAGTDYSCNDHGSCNGDGSCTCDNEHMNVDCSDCSLGYSGYPDCQFDAISDFVHITAGSFWMGSPDGCLGPDDYPGSCTSELGRHTDETLHYVELNYDFEMRRYEITEAEFEGLMGWNPMDTYDYDCTYGCGDDHPMKYISWYDTLAYANQLSLDAGLTPCYVLSNVGCEYGGSVGLDYMNCFDGDTTYGGIDSATVTLAGGVTKPQDCEGYRLPTEAEWEYAIRAGGNTAFYPSDGNDGTITDTGSDPNMDQIGWYYYNSTSFGTKSVGSKEANAWGLYDMSGNVYEWAWDWYASSYPSGTVASPLVGPTGAASGSYRVLRGGNWDSYAHSCRSASRNLNTPGGRSYGVGARLSRSSPAAAPTCDDSIYNGDETDVDCGGESCAACEAGRDCEEDTDCQSGICGMDKTCAEPTCVDGVRNGDETGVDCGGSCPPCPPGFVPITAGSFWMGSPAGTCPEGYPGSCTSELGRYTNEALHEVVLTYDFELSRYEITEAEFEGLMGWNAMDTYDSDCTYGCGDNHPMKYISWFDTLAYANQLSLDAGLTACYVLSNVGCENGGNVGADYMNCFDADATNGGIDSATVTLSGGATKPQECEGYRLPTEAEWEVAIRAGSTTAFYPSDGNDGTITSTSSDPNMDQIGWYYYNNTPYGTKPVGGKEANVWGLYDMSGNVWEWTWDWYQSAYQNDVATDPVGLASGSYRVVRGGNWGAYAQNCRSAYRGVYSPGGRFYYVGARLSRSSP